MVFVAACTQQAPNKALFVQRFIAKVSPPPDSFTSMPLPTYLHYVYPERNAIMNRSYFITNNKICLEISYYGLLLVGDTFTAQTVFNHATVFVDGRVIEFEPTMQDQLGLYVLKNPAGTIVAEAGGPYNVCTAPITDIALGDHITTFTFRRSNGELAAYSWQFTLLESVTLESVTPTPRPSIPDQAEVGKKSLAFVNEIYPLPVEPSSTYFEWSFSIPQPTKATIAPVCVAFKPAAIYKMARLSNRTESEIYGTMHIAVDGSARNWRAESGGSNVKCAWYADGPGIHHAVLYTDVYDKTIISYGWEFVTP